MRARINNKTLNLNFLFDDFVLFQVYVWVREHSWALHFAVWFGCSLSVIMFVVYVLCPYPDTVHCTWKQMSALELCFFFCVQILSSQRSANYYYYMILCVYGVVWKQFIAQIAHNKSTAEINIQRMMSKTDGWPGWLYFIIVIIGRTLFCFFSFFDSWFVSARLSRLVRRFVCRWRERDKPLLATTAIEDNWQTVNVYTLYLCCHDFNARIYGLCVFVLRDSRKKWIQLEQPRTWLDILQTYSYHFVELCFVLRITSPHSYANSFRCH